MTKSEIIKKQIELEGKLRAVKRLADKAAEEYRLAQQNSEELDNRVNSLVKWRNELNVLLEELNRGTK